MKDPQVLSTDDRAEICQAIEANGRAYFLHGNSEPIEEHRGISWLGRFVIDTQVEQDEAGSAIDEVLERFRQADASPRWRIGPTTRPPDLGGYLKERGLECVAPNGHRDEMPGMAIDLRNMDEVSPPPSGLTIGHVEDREGLREWVRVVAPLFGIAPDQEEAYTDYFLNRAGLEWPFRFYSGTLNGRLVATAQMYLGAGVAGLYYMSTASDVRRQGIGAAMLRTSLSEVYAMGCHIGVLASSPDGYDFYRSMGYREYCKLQTYSLA